VPIKQHHGVGIGKVDGHHDGVREAAAFGDRLEPLAFRGCVAAAPGRLDVDRLRDPAGLGLTRVLIDKVRASDATVFADPGGRRRVAVAAQPAISGPVEVPKVMVGVDDRALLACVGFEGQVA
jgi:hypothetical protein